MKCKTKNEGIKQTRIVEMEITHTYESCLTGTEINIFSDNIQHWKFRSNTFKCSIEKPIKGLSSQVNHVFCPYCGHHIKVSARSDTAACVANCLAFLFMISSIGGIAGYMYFSKGGEGAVTGTPRLILGIFVGIVLFAFLGLPIVNGIAGHDYDLEGLHGEKILN